MKKLYLLLTLLFTAVSGVWAQKYIQASTTKLSSITSGGYYIIDGVSQKNGTGHYLYDNGTRVLGGAIPTDETARKYVWKIVGNTTDGFTLQNLYTGNYMNLGTSNGSIISTNSTPQSNVIYFNSENYATICNANSNQAIDVASQGTTPTTWAGSITEATGSRRLMIYDVLLSDGVYTLKSYFSAEGYNDRYFTNNNGTLEFNTAKSNGVKDYWIIRQSGNETYPWKLESGRGDGLFLSPETGLSQVGGSVQINSCSSITSGSYYHLYGATYDNMTGDIRNLATWCPEGPGNNSGFARFGSGGCWGQGHNNTQWSTDYVIERVEGVELYTVESNISSGGVSYIPAYSGISTQTDGGFYILDTAPSVSDFTAIDVANYTAGEISINTTTKTITVNYTATYSYTLTDCNGATYVGTSNGTFGIPPTLSGCVGYSLSNEVWDETNLTYNATITFPFTVSSNGIINYTYIGQFASLNRTLQYAWHVESNTADDVIVQSDVLPTNEAGELEKWEWAIFPTLSDGSFTFTIKNAATDTYITCSSTQHNHEEGSVTLTNTGTPLTYVDNGNYGGKAWHIPSLNRYLSINSYQPTPSDMIQYLGQWNTSHYGTSVGFAEPADFNALLANLKSVYSSYNEYALYLIQGKYTEAVEGTFVSANDNSAIVRNVVKETPTSYLTAEQFNTFINAYNNAISGLTYVMPSGTFIRIKDVSGTKYVKSALGENNYHLFATGGTDALSIYYLNSANNLISYKTGFYSYAATCNCPIGLAPTYVDKYEFLLGSKAMQVIIHAANNPTTWSHGRYWTDGDTYVNRIASISDATDFMIEEVTSLPVTISSAKYATLYSPVALTIPSGVRAFYMSSIDGEEATLKEITTTIPAETPVVLYAENISEATTFDFVITTAETFAGTNLLAGNVATKAKSEGDLVLGVSNGVVGFYPYSGANLSGFKAYMPAANVPSEAKELRLVWDETTGIKVVSQADYIQHDNTAVFNLNGQRVNTPQRGIYIVNGKKVVVK